MRSLPFPPLEPPPAKANFPDPRLADASGIVALSRSMSPGLVLEAYRHGIFPWPLSQGLVPWASPNPRGIFPLHPPRPWPRHVRRAFKLGFEVSFDEAFRDVLVACADERVEGTWITADVIETYIALHRLGWAHSAEVWSPGRTELVGGLYGLAVGALFAGESMFHRRSGASKAAFAAVVARLRDRGFSLFDVQVPTPHLASLGCVAIARDRYLELLREAVAVQRAF